MKKISEIMDVESYALGVVNAQVQFRILEQKGNWLHEGLVARMEELDPYCPVSIIERAIEGLKAEGKIQKAYIEGYKIE